MKHPPVTTRDQRDNESRDSKRNTASQARRRNSAAIARKSLRTRLLHASTYRVLPDPSPGTAPVLPGAAGGIRCTPLMQNAEPAAFHCGDVCIPPNRLNADRPIWQTTGHRRDTAEPRIKRRNRFQENNLGQTDRFRGQPDGDRRPPAREVPLIEIRSSKGWPALARTHSEKRFQIVSGNAFVVLYAVFCSTCRLRSDPGTAESTASLG